MEGYPIPVNLDELHDTLQDYVRGGLWEHPLIELYEAMKNGAMAVMEGDCDALRADYDQFVAEVGSGGQAWFDWPGWARLLGPEPVFPNLEPLTNALRWEIWERDNFTCQECGVRRDLTVDHIVARSKGGQNVPSNLRTLCRRCNSAKGAR